MSRTRQERNEDAVFKALADPTRRGLLDQLRSGPKTTGELCAARAEMTRFGVMAHLRVLEEAGLVVPTQQGRFCFNHLNPVPIRQIYERWVRPYAEQQAVELLRLAHHVESKRSASQARGRRRS